MIGDPFSLGNDQDIFTESATISVVIETGISGLGYLLRKSSQNSRSGVAIQSNNKVRSGRFKNVQYISALIKKYEKRFDKLK